MNGGAFMQRGVFDYFQQAGVMAAGLREISVEVQPGSDPDEEELAQLAGRLRAELLDLDIDAVRRPVRGEAPDDA